ncbi:MAG: sugar ABC transporter permease [Rhizobiales bacterium]|nr:sugar ABC transporter permease [Hyphomicrobiales bacterium]
MAHLRQLQSKSGHPKRRDFGQPIDWIAYVFVALFTLPFLIFNIAPIAFSAYLSLMQWSIFGPPRFVGLKNYRDALHNDQIVMAFQNVLYYGLLIVPGVLVLGLAAALYVHQRWPLSAFARVCFFSPYVVSATVIGLIWVWLLDTQFGLVNHYLGFLGISKVPWLTSTDWALYGVSITSIWWDMGLAFVLLLAALQDILADLYDAAEVDGATARQRLWYVTLPQLRPVISMVVTLQLISTMRIFSQVYVMTSGGPASSSTSVLYELFTTAIRNQKFGLAAAVSMMLFALILVVTLLSRRLIREQS